MGKGSNEKKRDGHRKMIIRKGFESFNFVVKEKLGSKFIGILNCERINKEGYLSVVSQNEITVLKQTENNCWKDSLVGYYKRLLKKELNLLAFSKLCNEY